ncbi:MAG: alpha/beta fold hydrolase [Kiritimatiellae bacterium]|nr:alpha/beta fold hydrolase [Kiritimatiellia bacterium]
MKACARGRLRPVLGLGAAALLLLQVAAWNHARSFLNYRAGGPAAAIEALSAGDKILILFRGAARARPVNDRSPAQFGLEFETVTFSAADGADLEAWFIPAPGDRWPVLFFHGYGTSRSSLLEEAAAVRAMGHPVLLVDLRGSGGSTGNRTTLGVREAFDVQAAAEWIRGRLPDRDGLFLYGQSMGGAAVLRAVAVLGVEADGIVVEAVFDTMLNAVRNRFRALGWPAFPAAESLVLWGGVQCGFNGFRHNPAEYAAGTKVPTLVLHGEKDPRVTTEQAQRLFGRLVGPRFMVRFSSAGHSSCLAADSEKWRKAVRQCLEEAAAPAE